jgi:DNA-binding SARP family transcriptional activator
VATSSARTVQRAHALAARYFAYLGDAEGADEQLAAVDRHPPADRLIARRRLIARAARDVLAGDEAGAADELGFLVEDGEVNPFLAAQKTVLRVLPLVYVLVPASRESWDAAELGPTFAGWRDLARALVAARGGDLGPVAGLGALEPGSVRAALPLPWVVELAAALAAVDRPEGEQLLDALGAGGHPHLAARAEVDAGARRLLATVPRPPDEPVEVRLLGPPELLRGGQREQPAGWRRERVRELLAFLVVHPATTREAVAAALWPDRDEEAAQNNLRGTLSHLLGVLQPERTGRAPSWFLRVADRAIALVGHDRLTVDVWAFEAELDEAERAERAGTPSLALVAHRRAVARWRGPFAGGATWAWAEHEAERLTARYVRAAGRAAELALAAGEAAEAEDLARAVLDLDPWSEPAYRALATAQLDLGNPSAARTTLRRCREALAELGVEPEPSTRMVERRVNPGR